MEDVLIKKFIGKNADVIYNKMEKKGSFNIFCMLFSFLYFFYRKMYLIGLLSFIIQSIIANYVKNFFVSILCMITLGFIFYPLYKIHVTKKINKIKEKATTVEEINNMCIKKGGTSILLIIMVPLLLVVILIASLGMTILNSATNVADNKGNNTTFKSIPNMSNVPSASNSLNTSSISNTPSVSNYYSYEGAEIKYGDEWQQMYAEIGSQKYKTLCEKNGNIIIVCLDVSNIGDGITDYSISSKRQELYNEMINTVSATYVANGVTMSKQTYGFKPLVNNMYYAYYETYKDSYARIYTILNPVNNKVASLMVVFSKYITDADEAKINNILENTKF